MTSHIDEGESSNYSRSQTRSYKQSIQEVRAPKDELMRRLENQLAHSNEKKENNPGTRHDDKAAVLQVAINVLKGEASLQDLEQAKTDNPKYNKALFSSETEELVDLVTERVQKSGPGIK